VATAEYLVQKSKLLECEKMPPSDGIICPAELLVEFLYMNFINALKFAAKILNEF